MSQHSGEDYDDRPRMKKWCAGRHGRNREVYAPPLLVGFVGWTLDSFDFLSSFS
jgi:hypothetical protein